MRRALSVSIALAAGALAIHCSSSGKSSMTGLVGDAGTDAKSSHILSGAPTGPSCAGGGVGQAGCGTSVESCCASLVVTGGTYFRSYDGLSTDGASKAYAATVSDVAVDRYEVTVGRFRAFVDAVVGGWLPQAGSGKHSYLKGGGLNGGAETGWDASWSANLATKQSDWTTNLSCRASTQTWTASAGASDDLPVNCVDWYEAYAFCIWDGGFLPSEAEWNYTASGGSQQRAYPWSAAYPPGSTTLDCEHANYSKSWPTGACVASGPNKVGSESPEGDGRWGQSDMAGNVFEWTLDWYDTSYSTTCDDCAELTPTVYRVIRGGSFNASPACLLDSLRETSTPDGRSDGIGVRCARAPG
jgi:formylglycine-generating enzyme required for sulfatase activity